MIIEVDSPYGVLEIDVTVIFQNDFGDTIFYKEDGSFYFSKIKDGKMIITRKIKIDEIMNISKMKAIVIVEKEGKEEAINSIKRKKIGF